MYYRINRKRVPLTAEQTAANAKAKADRLKATMTCQCCARRYLANTGTIAHHGYERPGSGWQTASCIGAKSLPFEVSRDRLGELIKGLKQNRKGQREALSSVQLEVTPISRSWRAPDYRKERPTYITVEVTRANFDEHKSNLYSRGCFYGHDFNGLLEDEVKKRKAKIAAITTYINECQTRFDGWKQTHQWDREAEKWTKI